MALDGRVETIENGSAAFSFDRGSGALVSVRNRVTGNEYLQGTAERGNVFAVYYDFTGEFEITGAERESPHADAAGGHYRQRLCAVPGGHAAVCARRFR